MKLRQMCKGSEGHFNVLAVYDICRSDLSKFAGLRRGEDDNTCDAGPNVNYVSISGTDPRGTVAAASKLAVMLFAECDAAAEEHKYGWVKIPHCWIDFNGEDGMVEKSIMGKSYWLPWGEPAGQEDGQEEKKEETKAAPVKAIPDTIEEEKKQPPKPIKNLFGGMIKAFQPQFVSQVKNIPPPKPLTVLNDSGKWTPEMT